MQKIIIDTGPLVAFINKRDDYHSWITEQFSELHPPFLTCEAVLSEAAFLLSRLPQGKETLLELLQRNLLQIPFRLDEEAGAIQMLMSRYQNVPMSLADACLVRMAEQHHQSRVLTLDSDFQVYRKNNKQIIPLLSPHLS